MALGELLPVGSVDHWHMTKNWGHMTEGPVHRELFRRIGNVIVAPQHMRDLHVDVVHDHGKVVEGGAIGPQNHKIANILTLQTDALVHRVVPRQLTGGDAQPDRILHHVGLALFTELIGHLLVPAQTSALEDGRLVPVEAEPREAVEDDLGVFVGGTGLVGVFDAQQELAALFAGEEPVEEGSSGSANVEVAGGRRGEADADTHLANNRAFMKASEILHDGMTIVIPLSPEVPDAASPAAAARGTHDPTTASRHDCRP